MANTLSAIDNLEPFLGGTLQSVAEKGPRDAGDFWDANKDHVRRVFLANFDVQNMRGDHLAPCMVHAFETLWTQLPGRISSMEDQSRLIRVLYCIGSHAKAVRQLLEIGHIRRLDEPMTPIVFRDRKADDFPKPGSGHHGTIARMATEVAKKRLPEGSLVDEAAYAKQLKLMRLRIGCDDRSQQFKSPEGVVGGRLMDHATAVRPVVGEVELGKRKARINKSGAGIQEFQVEALGWDEMGYTMPIAIIRELVDTYADRALVIADAADVIPKKG